MRALGNLGDASVKSDGALGSSGEYARVPQAACLPVRIEHRQALADQPPAARRQPEIQLIDVTDLMVKPSEPDDTTLKAIEDMRMQGPVPLKELERDHS